MTLFPWLRSCTTVSSKRNRRAAGAREQFRPSLELLEDRTVPSNLHVTSTADGGIGSFRRALSQAASGDVILFSSALHGQTITLSHELVVRRSVEIRGPGAGLLTISGGNATRIFEIMGTPSVTISGLTLSGGQASSNSGGTGGGAIYNHQASLSLRTCSFTGNTAIGNSMGGAIASDAGSLAIDTCLFANNSTGFASGGAIFSAQGTIVINNSTFQNNQANSMGLSAFGGAIDNVASNLTIFASTFASNVVNQGSAGASDGGAVYNQSGTVTIISSTFTANQARNIFSSPSGGAIANNTGSITVDSCTIAGNSTSTGLMGTASGGGIDVGGGSCVMRDTIVAGNTVSGPTTAGPDISGTVQSLGNNLIQSTSGATITGTTASNITGQTPNLGPLANNSGPTQTMALLAGSPAIDKGSVPPSTLLDQRSFTRVVGPAMDIGAFEFGASLPKVSVSVAFGPAGQVTLVTHPDGRLIRQDSTGSHLLATGVASASIAFGPTGQVILITRLDGSLTQYDSTGSHQIATGVASASVAFGPAGKVLLITKTDSSLVRIDSTGTHQLGQGVRTASVAIGPFEADLITYSDGTLVRRDGAGAAAMGGGVLAASVTFGPQGEVTDVIHQDGKITQYDKSGAHVIGMI
jgi:hypothetical protein